MKTGDGGTSKRVRKEAKGKGRGKPKLKSPAKRRAPAAPAAPANAKTAKSKSKTRKKDAASAKSKSTAPARTDTNTQADNPRKGLKFTRLIDDKGRPVHRYKIKGKTVDVVMGKKGSVKARQYKRIPKGQGGGGRFA